MPEVPPVKGQINDHRLFTKNRVSSKLSYLWWIVYVSVYLSYLWWIVYVSVYLRQVSTYIIDLLITRSLTHELHTLPNPFHITD